LHVKLTNDRVTRRRSGSLCMSCFRIAALGCRPSHTASTALGQYGQSPIRRPMLEVMPITTAWGTQSERRRDCLSFGRTVTMPRWTRRANTCWYQTRTISR